MAEAPEAIYNQPISFSPRVHTQRERGRTGRTGLVLVRNDLNAAETHLIHRSFLPALCPPLLLRVFPLLPLPLFRVAPFSLSRYSPFVANLSNGPAITYNFMPGI